MAEEVKKKIDEKIYIFDYGHYAKELIEKDVFEPLEMVETNSILDKFYGGIPKNSLSIICGGTGEGKSLLALHLAFTLSKTKSVLYIQCENAGAVDQSRMRDVVKLYDCNTENIIYVNIKEIPNLNKEKFSSILEGLKGETLGIDVIIIDSLQNIMYQEEEGSGMYKQGNDLGELLTTIALEKTLLLTWQLSRGIKSKAIDQVTTDDISQSLGISRYAAAMFLIKKDNKSDWRVKGIKSRTIELSEKAEYVRRNDSEGSFVFNINLN